MPNHHKYVWSHCTFMAAVYMKYSCYYTFAGTAVFQVTSSHSLIVQQAAAPFYMECILKIALMLKVRPVNRTWLLYCPAKALSCLFSCNNSSSLSFILSHRC